MTRSSAAVLTLYAGFAVTVPLLVGCGGGGGNADASTLPAPVVVSGAITFDRVPVAGNALDYTAIEAIPARGVSVQALADGRVIASAVTDDAGRYALSVPADTPNVTVRALAEMRRDGTPGWAYRVVDNTADDTLFVLEGPGIEIGRTDRVLNLHAPSGWDGSAYTAPRAAAPFAILDVVREATDFVLASAPDTVFPPLILHWSPNNVPSPGADGEADFTSGEIGSSLYRRGFGIYLLGDADGDTDEYDRHVIAHEWAHYLEQAIGRSDSIGGPHTRGDQLDMRTAFSEGFANAFAAMALRDTRYVDVLGPGQSEAFSFDIEGPFAPLSAFPNPFPGWFSEESIQEIVYDLFDAEQDRPEDTLELGFAPLLDVLADMKDGRALTSIFAFAHALRTRFPQLSAQIDALLAAHSIGPFTNAYADGETNSGWPLAPARVETADILPIYKELSLGGNVNVCSSDAYTYPGETGFYNKLGARAFVRFEAPATGTYAFSATATAVPAGKRADPDVVLHGAGVLHVSEAAPDDAACTPETPLECAETFERFLGPGEYVLEVYEWTNTQASDAENPPIGRTCFDVTVSVR